MEMETEMKMAVNSNCSCCSSPSPPAPLAPAASGERKRAEHIEIAHRNPAHAARREGALVKFEKWSKVVSCFYLADGPYGPLTQSHRYVCIGARRHMPKITRWPEHNPVSDLRFSFVEHVSPG